jgi:hypothetical protein
MKLSQILLLAAALIIPTVLLSQSAMPRMTAVEPMEAKAGDTLTVTGENLEKSNVAKVYLTDGKNDIVTPVAEQTATSMKIKVPNGVKAGRWALMLLTAGNDPKLIEQPVKVTIE